MANSDYDTLYIYKLNKYIFLKSTTKPNNSNTKDENKKMNDIKLKKNNISIDIHKL